MAKRPPKASKQIFNQLRNLIDSLEESRTVELKSAYPLVEKKIEVPHKNLPFRLDLGGSKGKRLHLYPEIPLDGSRLDHHPSFILVDPERFFDTISGFVRIEEGDKLVLGRHDSLQGTLFHYPKEVKQRHLTLTHKGDRLVFRDLSDGAGTVITPLTEDKERYRYLKWRADKLAQIREMFGGPLKILDSADAMDTLKTVNNLMDHEPYRHKNSAGNPGGVLGLPDSVTPIIVGDLHAQVDNLLVVLSQNNFLDAIDSGKAALIILGDAVHSETPGELEEMGSSILIMDLILKLKLRFPKRVFYIRGNHDSYSSDIGKGGVPQGLLWRRALESERGEEYCAAMESFCTSLPYVVYSKNFLTCHAGPPKAKVDKRMVINITQYPGLQSELMTNRICDSNRPAGYTKGDVKRFRKAFNLANDTPFIVGHTPLTIDDTVWMNVGGADNHHVVFAAAPYDVAVFTRVNKQMVPLHYPTEPLTGILNNLKE